MSELTLPEPLPFLPHSLAAGVVSLKELIIDMRQRKEDVETLLHIADLEASIKRIGLIQPPVVEVLSHPRGGVNIFNENIVSDKLLIAGWCRTNALKNLGQETFPYCLRESLSLVKQKELEFEENFWRKSMSWQDNVCAIADIHKLHTDGAKRESTSWGYRETGKLLRKTHGYVNYSVKLAEYIRAGDSEIINCDGVVAAMDILSQRKEDEAAKIIENRRTANLLQFPLDIDLPTSPTIIPANEASKPTINFPLSQKCLHIDCHDYFAACEPDTFDLIYTDIPFGIEMDDLTGRVDMERVNHSHDVDENLSQMPRFINGAFKVLKNNSYLLFWYDLKHHEKLLAWLQEAGFTTQDWPLLWLKTHGCKNRASHCWWTKNFEYIMVARKGTATLRNPQQSAYFSADGRTDRGKQSHPFSKPIEVSKHFLSPLVVEGMKVLDCYAGQGSLVEAMLQMHLDVTCIENDPIHFPYLIERYRTILSSRYGKNITFS